MGWKQRRGRTYYYRSVRRGGQVVSEYVGQGLLADLAANIDARERHSRTMARHDLEDIIHRQRRVDGQIEAFRRQVRGVVADTLHAAGFHQHKRQWRKARRMADAVTRKATTGEFNEFYDLMRIAGKQSAKSADVEKCRKYAQEYPSVFDGISLLFSSTITVMMDSRELNEATKIAITGEFHALRRKLGKDTVSPLEKLLIDDVAICWLRVQFAEQLYSQNLTGSGVSWAKADYLERCLSATHRRYLQAIESLARVRGLLARVGLQVNVAQQMLVQNG